MDPITRLYQNFREQAQPWAIASTSTEALASDIEEIIADDPAGYPATAPLDYRALARQVQTLAAAEPVTDLAALPALLTADEVAAVLRLHPTTVKLLMRSGELPGRKIGGQWRLLKTDLLTYLGAELDDFTGATPPADAAPRKSEAAP